MVAVAAVVAGRAEAGDRRGARSTTGGRPALISPVAGLTAIEVAPAGGPGAWSYDSR